MADDQSRPPEPPTAAGPEAEQRAEAEIMLAALKRDIPDIFNRDR